MFKKFKSKKYQQQRNINKLLLYCQQYAMLLARCNQEPGWSHKNAEAE